MLLLLSILHLISEIFLLIVVKFYLHTWVCLCLCLVECCNFVGRMCDLLVLNSFEWWLIWAWWKIFRSSLGHTVAWLGPNHNETFFVLYILLYYYKATSVFCSSRFIVLRSLDFEVCLKKERCSNSCNTMSMNFHWVVSWLSLNGLCWSWVKECKLNLGWAHFVLRNLYTCWQAELECSNLDWLMAFYVHTHIGPGSSYS